MNNCRKIRIFLLLSCSYVKRLIRVWRFFLHKCLVKELGTLKVKSSLRCQDFQYDGTAKKPFGSSSSLSEVAKVVLPIIGRWLEVVNGVERRNF